MPTRQQAIAPGHGRLHIFSGHPSLPIPVFRHQPVDKPDSFALSAECLKPMGIASSPVQNFIQVLLKSLKFQLGMVVHVCNLSTWGVETGGSGVQGLPQL